MAIDPNLAALYPANTIPPKLSNYNGIYRKRYNLPKLALKVLGGFIGSVVGFSLLHKIVTKIPLLEKNFFESEDSHPNRLCFTASCISFLVCGSLSHALTQEIRKNISYKLKTLPQLQILITNSPENLARSIHFQITSYEEKILSLLNSDAKRGLAQQCAGNYKDRSVLFEYLCTQLFQIEQLSFEEVIFLKTAINNWRSLHSKTFIYSSPEKFLLRQWMQISEPDACFRKLQQILGSLPNQREEFFNLLVWYWLRYERHNTGIQIALDGYAQIIENHQFE